MELCFVLLTKLEEGVLNLGLALTNKEVGLLLNGWPQLKEELVVKIPLYRLHIVFQIEHVVNEGKVECFGTKISVDIGLVHTDSRSCCR